MPPPLNRLWWQTGKIYNVDIARHWPNEVKAVCHHNTKILQKLNSVIRHSSVKASVCCNFRKCSLRSFFLIFPAKFSFYPVWCLFVMMRRFCHKRNRELCAKRFLPEQKDKKQDANSFEGHMWTLNNVWALSISQHKTVIKGATNLMSHPSNIRLGWSAWKSINWKFSYPRLNPWLSLPNLLNSK